jgi:hypothetical protein
MRGRVGRSIRERNRGKEWEDTRRENRELKNRSKGGKRGKEEG